MSASGWLRANCRANRVVDLSAFVRHDVALRDRAKFDHFDFRLVWKLLCRTDNNPRGSAECMSVIE